MEPGRPPRSLVGQQALPSDVQLVVNQVVLVSADQGIVPVDLDAGADDCDDGSPAVVPGANAQAWLYVAVGAYELH